MSTTSSTNFAAVDGVSLRPRLLTFRRILSALAAIAALAISWKFAEVDLSLLFRPATAAAIWTFVAHSFPPDLSPPFLRTVLQATAQTVATAVAGTLLSVVFAVPLGILATGTLWNRGVLVAAEGRAAYKAGWIVNRLARALLGFLRAVPDLMWALLFVASVGLGPLAGTLALAVSYGGILGRVYADVFEHVDPQPLEAIQSTGATPMQIFLRGIWPQALPHLTAYTLYSFECCLRAAAVLGFVGAGGIGYEISVSMRLFDYGQVLTLLLVFVLLLTLIDAASRHVRARLAETSRNPAAEYVSNENQTLPPKFVSRPRGLALPITVLLVVSYSFFVAGFSPAALSQAHLATLMEFVGRMFPLDLSWSFLKGLGVPLVQTIATSLMGTLAGVALASVLAIPATSTLTLLRADSPGRHGFPQRALRWVFFYGARFVLNVLRSIPELVWVLICIIAVGIGPFAGTIALGLHTAGVLGKLYAETMEEVPLRPIEALRCLGARPLQILLWAIWPQARPLLASYSVLRWESNLRASTILGLVGGGGLGQAIYNNVQLGFYPRLTTLILLVYGLVLACDWIGERLRLHVA
ncbi:MAG TPA: phosphonate ABC transporter, permease protein PhnE [Candidatus Binatia bacterium]|nr:phosphonate ABC transporter, permease protein PhnE [Candidatus Binatia bacterium]